MISGALTRLINAVIAYNTWKLHQVPERSGEAGRRVPSVNGPSKDYRRREMSYLQETVTFGRLR